jgi:hypothetical protein
VPRSRKLTRASVTPTLTGDVSGDGAVVASVVPGSGRGELEGLTGKAKFGAIHGPKAEFELDYRIS